MERNEDAAAEAWPTEVRLFDGGRALRVAFEDGAAVTLSAGRLREASRSVDARRVAPGPGREVTITGVQPVGNYAVQLAFDDGHDTGIYDWPTLRALGAN